MVWIVSKCVYSSYHTLCRYLIYNKPWVLKQWFKEAKPVQEYFLVLDSDMIIHRPFLPNQFRVGPGAVVCPSLCKCSYINEINHVFLMFTGLGCARSVGCIV